MIVIKQEIIDQIKSDSQVKSALAYAFRKGIRTIERWIHDNDVILTTALAVKTISKETGIPESELLTEIEPAA